MSLGTFVRWFAVTRCAFITREARGREDSGARARVGGGRGIAARHSSRDRTLTGVRRAARRRRGARHVERRALLELDARRSPLSVSPSRCGSQARPRYDSSASASRTAPSTASSPRTATSSATASTSSGSARGTRSPTATATSTSSSNRTASTTGSPSAPSRASASRGCSRAPSHHSRASASRRRRGRPLSEEWLRAADEDLGDVDGEAEGGEAADGAEGRERRGRRRRRRRRRRGGRRRGGRARGGRAGREGHRSVF